MSIRRHELNSLKVLKGKIGGKRFPIWDTIKDCDEDCKLIEECPFQKERNGVKNKCFLMGNFIRTMMDIALDNLPAERNTEYSLQKIGLTLLPLYKQLIQLQMLEHTLEDITIGDDSKTKIHPVFKEIRIVCKDIDKCLKSLGIDKNPLGDGEGLSGALGDPDYYESMQEDHEEYSKS